MQWGVQRIQCLAQEHITQVQSVKTSAGSICKWEDSGWKVKSLRVFCICLCCSGGVDRVSGLRKKVSCAFIKQWWSVHWVRVRDDNGDFALTSSPVASACTYLRPSNGKWPAGRWTCVSFPPSLQKLRLKTFSVYQAVNYSVCLSPRSTALWKCFCCIDCYQTEQQHRGKKTAILKWPIDHTFVCIYKMGENYKHTKSQRVWQGHIKTVFVKSIKPDCMYLGCIRWYNDNMGIWSTGWKWIVFIPVGTLGNFIQTLPLNWCCSSSRQ